MKSLLVYIPFFLSFLNGLLLIRILFKEEKAAYLLRLALSGGLGLGMSAYIAYINFMILNRYSALFQIAANLVLLLLVIWGNVISGTFPRSWQERKESLRRDGLYVLLLGVLFIPVYYVASFYPYGGWDAWAVWHFKSKFLFLAGENWRQLFDPLLWRSSPHYPLLLPFINTWGWAFQSEAVYLIPLLTTLVFTFLTAALIVASLAPFIDKRIAFFPALILLTLPLYVKTAISQYADIVLGYYLLGAVVCAIQSRLERNSRYAFVSGLFCGFMSFCKPEGLIAASILMGLFVVFNGWPRQQEQKDQLFLFVAGAGITLPPSLLFYLFIAPDNVTGINGFVSSANPSTWIRLKTILMFYAIELISVKWNGLWIILLAAALLGAHKTFRRETLLIVFFLLLYTLTIILYYWMNTYFEVLWWLSVTLNRILASLLPLFLWWIFYSLWKKEA